MCAPTPTSMHFSYRTSALHVHVGKPAMYLHALAEFFEEPVHVPHGRQGVVDRQKDLASVREGHFGVMGRQRGGVASDGGLDLRFPCGHNASVEVHLCTAVAICKS